MTQSREQRLEQALTFYAQPENWISGRWSTDDLGEEAVDNLLCVGWQVEDGGVVPVADMGEVARQALLDNPRPLDNLCLQVEAPAPLPAERIARLNRLLGPGYYEHFADEATKAWPRELLDLTREVIQVHEQLRHQAPAHADRWRTVLAAILDLPAADQRKIGLRVGGWAAGNYLSTCYRCKATFEGDKRAISCLPCALQSLSKGDSVSG